VSWQRKADLVQTSVRAEGEAISLMLAGSLNEIASGAALKMTFEPIHALLSWRAFNDLKGHGKVIRSK
jgi:hypothetical protein